MTIELSRGWTPHDRERIYWELATLGPDDDRPVVVLSHGAGGSHAIWYQQVPALAAHFRVLTWDARGFGNSTNDTGSPSVDGAAGDLGAILDELQIETAHLVGQSMGGWHISGFATHAPYRVRSLVYADTIGGLWTDALRADFAQFQKRGGLEPDGPTLLGAHRALWPGTAERDPAHAFLYQALGSFHEPPMGSLGETIAWDIPHERVSSMEVPVLFVAGTHDEIFTPELLADSAGRVGATFVEIADAGHSPYFEQPTAWNEAVLDFLLAVPDTSD